MEYSRIAMHPLFQIRQNLCVIRERYGVSRIGLFGSVARGEETPASDIDVLVEFREGEETFDHFMDLKFYLEDLLGRKTDLVIADTLKPRIRDAVLGEVVYAWRSPVVS
ncbi:MAG: Nucleotidyltransferase domain protein [Euryarchaeota archaeon ADurb.Bin009]|nr:MAG: Nucleotidyltransferase domain protein [Euryarchaeota archaeon ADurb.Bin009]HNV38262.1 nucleotidyltransferase family protein [Methanoculleus sp.]HOC83288.1 nucleotidyltransferase family protein [Methanoculleus sp.]